MMRRIVAVSAAFVVALAGIAALATPAESVSGFGDVAGERFYVEPVQWMVDNDITTGTSATCFSPDDPVTRGQAAAFLWRIEGSPSGAPPHPFDDVVRGWQQAPVSWMASAGITTGTSPSTYSPADTLTRGQMAALIHRAAAEPAATPTTFADVIRDWQLIPVGWMEAAGITTGTSPTTFSPAAAVTRGQFAAFAYRWKGSPPVVVDPASPLCSATTTTLAPSSTTTQPSVVVPPEQLFNVDWWGCWWAAHSQTQGGSTPGNGATVARLPNCADGPSSVGQPGDMSETGTAPEFRSAGANGYPSIEFTHAGDTLLKTNGGGAWSGGDVLDGGSEGVTLAWIGMTTDLAGHNTKYVVTGLDSGSEYPQLLIDGEGLDRFTGYGGGNSEARSDVGTISDLTIHGVILYLSPSGSSSSVEVDGTDLNQGLDSAMRGDVAGLTLGNFFSQNFSTTDHQFVFLGLREGPMSGNEKAEFWSYLAEVRGFG
jgi:hypothetical protein